MEIVVRSDCCPVQSRNGRIRRVCPSWDVEEAKVIGQLPAKKSGRLAATFSHDGKSIATSCNNGSIRVWQKQ